MSTACHSAIKLCSAVCASSIVVEESTSATIQAPVACVPFACADADGTGVGDGPCELASNENFQFCNGDNERRTTKRNCRKIVPKRKWRHWADCAVHCALCSASPVAVKTKDQRACSHCMAATTAASIDSSVTHCAVAFSGDRSLLRSGISCGCFCRN